MLTLSYGYKKPQSNDKGPVVFPALEDNIQQLNDHTHDGTDSAKLPSSSVEAVTQAISAASWTLVSGGLYKQTVTLPGGIDYDKISITIHDDATGHLLYLTIEKVSSSQYDVYINDNSLDLVAVYT